MKFMKKKEQEADLPEEVTIPVPNKVTCDNCEDSGKACLVCHAGDLVE